MTTDLSLNDRLAVLDGLCRHEWTDGHRLANPNAVANWFCPNCDDHCCEALGEEKPHLPGQRCHHLEDDLPRVGDGHHNYLSLDALRALAGRLGLFWSLGNIHHRDHFQSDVRGPTGPQGCIDPDPVTALGEAICAVMEDKANA